MCILKIHNFCFRSFEMADPEPEQEPKHPYVTRQNGTVHFVFSIILIILSIVQVIHWTFQIYFFVWHDKLFLKVPSHALACLKHQVTFPPPAHPILQHELVTVIVGYLIVADFKTLKDPFFLQLAGNLATKWVLEWLTSTKLE